MNTICNNCKKEVPLKKAFECELCNDDEDDDDYEEDVVEDVKDTKPLVEDNKDNVVKPDPPIMFCKRCTHVCFGCDARGCDKCLENACCDCSVYMCKECRNNETLCGCYGKCFWCGRDVNRG